MTIEENFQTAAQLHEAGKLDESEAIYRQILAQDSRHADSLHLLGVIAAQHRQFDSASDLIRQAIAIRPDVAQYYLNLALAFRESNQPALAIPCLRQALAFDAGNASLFHRLGIVLHQAGQNDDAVAALTEAARLRPEVAEHHYRLGIVLAENEKYPEALAAFDRTLELNPGSAVASSSKGAILTKLRRRAEARACLNRAIETDPKFAGAYNNLGNLLEDEGNWTQALDAYRQAIALDPAEPSYHWNYSRALLTVGQWKEGWEEYEWRLKRPKLGWYKEFAAPQWDSSHLAGKSIITHAEGGYGDMLHFARFAPLLAKRGAKVFLECSPVMTTLLKSLANVEIVARGQTRPQCDWHIPLQSVPRIFNIAPESVPNKIPYLSAPADKSRRWAQRLADQRVLRVGLVWSGSDRSLKEDRTRTIDAFAPLAEIAGVRFFSLQKGDAAAQTPPSGMEILDFTSELNDFADTAALVENLDLVVTVDTSMSHLAGALGKPVWVLIPFKPYFFWLLDRTDSPWYPTMRLFRQPKEDDWDTPVRQMAKALRELAR